MAEIRLDGLALPSLEAVHDRFAQALPLPEWYGRNLDALYDLLSEREGPTRLLVRRRAALLDGLGEYGGALCRTLEDAGRANPGLEVVFSED